LQDYPLVRNPCEDHSMSAIPISKLELAPRCPRQQVELPANPAFCKPEACQNRSRWLRPAGRHHRKENQTETNPGRDSRALRPLPGSDSVWGKTGGVGLPASTTGYGAFIPSGYQKAGRQLSQRSRVVSTNKMRPAFGRLIIRTRDSGRAALTLPAHRGNKEVRLCVES
jgi:hypothetical protein